MSRAVMQQALEALEWNHNNDLNNIPACEQWAKMLKETITALHAALAEPEQEPDGISWLKRDRGYFTAPTPRRPLTDEEIADLWEGQLFHITDLKLAIDFVRDIERTHGIGEQP